MTLAMRYTESPIMSAIAMQSTPPTGPLTEALRPRGAIFRLFMIDQSEGECGCLVLKLTTL